MRFRELIELPEDYWDAERGMCHESLLRGYQTLREVHRLLLLEVPPKVVAEFIEEVMEWAKESQG